MKAMKAVAAKAESKSGPGCNKKGTVLNRGKRPAAASAHQTQRSEPTVTTQAGNPFLSLVCHNPERLANLLAEVLEILSDLRSSVEGAQELANKLNVENVDIFSKLQRAEEREKIYRGVLFKLCDGDRNHPALREAAEHDLLECIA